MPRGNTRAQKGRPNSPRARPGSVSSSPRVIPGPVVVQVAGQPPRLVSPAQLRALQHQMAGQLSGRPRRDDKGNRRR